jgi:hypothetical protein
MFSGFFKTLFEPFTVSDSDRTSHENLRYYYGDKRPNAILTGRDSNIPLTGPTTTYMGDLIDQINGPRNYSNQVGINRRSNALSDNSVLATNSLTSDLLTERQAACQSLGTATTAFGHLSNLAANVNPTSRIRCGWVYNNANPNNGMGVYGTINGPVVDPPLGGTWSGTWMWNLNDAKKKFQLHICNTANTPTGATCSLLNNPSYSNICGFCKTTNRFIPINGSLPAYPHDAISNCSSTNLVTTPSMCPRPTVPPAPGSAAALAYLANKGTCDPLLNGSLPRDCLIQTAEQAGCSNNGTIITALRSGSDTNYIDSLTPTVSYITYQQRAVAGLNATALQTGKLTVTDALNDFQEVFNNTTSPNLGLKASAIDLCFTKGSLENYDFCSELQPTSRSPFSIDCLQKQFKRAGGQETGSLYPSVSTYSSWSVYDTWADVNAAITALQTASSNTNTDRGSQERAIKQFQGIPLDNRSSPLFSLNSLNNVEIFWFTSDTDIKSDELSHITTFLGRRIRSQIPILDDSTDVTGASRGSFVFFTNMAVSQTTRFRLQFTGDSGFVFARNRGYPLGATNSIPMTQSYSRYNTYNSANGVDVTNKEMSALYNSFGNPNSQMTSAHIWTIQPNVPNIITGYYIGNGNNFKISYKQDTDAPEVCSCYGQRSSDDLIRLYNKAECDALNGNFYSNGECIVRTGGSYSAGCRPLNPNETCTTLWGPIPRSMLFLIQDPYAPMISFNVIQNFAAYNCDFNFMDKRLSSHKMRWMINSGSGPTPSYSSNGDDTPTYPLGMSYLYFANGSIIKSVFSFKIYSFMTLVLIMRFKKLPRSGFQSMPLQMPTTYPSMESPALFVVGNSNNTTAKLCIGSDKNPELTNTVTNAYRLSSPAKSTDGPTVEVNKTYLITINARRTVESDISTLKSMTVGAILLSTPNAALVQSSPVVWPQDGKLDAPDSGTKSTFFIGGDTDCEFDLFSLQMYDYILTGSNLVHAAKNDWATPSPNPPTSAPENQNPYV